MALRIYDGVLKSRSHRISKGRKKKFRRYCRAESRDGWQRKKANGLAPVFRSSKKELEAELS